MIRVVLIVFILASCTPVKTLTVRNSTKQTPCRYVIVTNRGYTSIQDHHITPGTRIKLLPSKDTSILIFQKHKHR